MTKTKYIKKPTFLVLSNLIKPMNNTELTKKTFGLINNLNRNKINQSLKTLIKHNLVKKQNGKYIRNNNEVEIFYREIESRRKK